MASTLPPALRLARPDPAYHPVLSDVKDIQPSVHLAAQAARAWLRSRRPRPAPAPRTPAPAPAPRHKRPPTRLKRGRPPLSRKLRERDSRGERDEETSTPGNESYRSRGRPSTESRLRRQSYDIDNIVIPQSVAANTRPQILTYKEILTPKWRVLEIPEVPLNNGISKSFDLMSMESEEEDISESAVHARHVRAEQRERGRYARKPRPRRPNADANHDAPPPAPAPAPPPHPVQPVEPREWVRPYSPRQFPLGEATYHGMVADMPLGHTAPSEPARSRSASPSPASPASRASPASPAPDSDYSALSPLSNPAYDGDDPDDAEWDPSAEKLDRKKYFR